MKEYMNNKNIEQAVSAAKEMKPPKHFLSEMLNKMVVYSLDRSDEDREHTSTLIHTLCTEGMVTGEHLLQVCADSAKSNCQPIIPEFPTYRLFIVFFFLPLYLRHLWAFWTNVPRLKKKFRW